MELPVFNGSRSQAMSKIRESSPVAAELTSSSAKWEFGDTCGLALPAQSLIYLNARLAERQVDKLENEETRNETDQAPI